MLGRAFSYLGAHLGDPISVSHAAAASRGSVRALQLLFQRQPAATPVAHGAVGRRLGCTNLGRCSAHERSEFGESPSRASQCTPGTDPRSA